MINIQLFEERKGYGFDFIVVQSHISLMRRTRNGQICGADFSEMYVTINCIKYYKIIFREFAGGPVVRTPCFHCQGPGFDPWSGN